MILRHILEHRAKTMPSTIAHELSLYSAGNTDDTLVTLCKEAIAALTEEAQAVRDGNRNVINKLVGFVMKRSRGTADAKAARDKLQELLRGGP